MFGDAVKIVPSISSATDSTHPQSEIDSICGLCTGNYETKYWRNQSQKYNLDYVVF